MLGLKEKKSPFKGCVFWVVGAQVLICLVGLFVPEMDDLYQFKKWTHWAYVTGIHQAYAIPEFQYDWLPLYLYFCKIVGAFYHISGAMAVFGEWSRALSFLLKLQMMFFHLATGGFVYGFCLHLGVPNHKAQKAFFFYVFNPGLLVATHVLGFQDALHTALVFGGALALVKQRIYLAFVLIALVGLSKPQAVIYLIPMGLYGFWAFETKDILKGVVVGCLALGVVLLPFVVYEQMGGVVDMYVGVSHVHEWLTGYAHNFWWLVQPIPPYYSDRLPLWLGVNGMGWGLLFLFFFTVCVCVKFYRHLTDWQLIHACALLGFVFFMVVTEIHENHLYAMFVFLVPLAVIDRRFGMYYWILSFTFMLNMVLAVWWLDTGQIISMGEIRVGTLNAVCNLGILLFWGGDYFFRQVPIEKTMSSIKS